MKLKFIHINILICIIIIKLSNCVKKGKDKIYEADEYSISYRTSLIDNKRQKQFTEVIPDESSSPLRLSKEQIGRFSWAVLHSIAAAYSNNPTDEDKNDIINFLNSFANLFPCKVCGKHFKEMLKENPVKNNNREELVFYLCGLHNKVNEKLNKPIFDCKKAFDFWGGNCGCSGDKPESQENAKQEVTKNNDKNSTNTN